MRFHKLAAALLVACCFVGNAIAEDSPAGLDEADQDDIALKEAMDEGTPEPYSPPDGSEAYGFEAEVSRMLDIVVNSLYQNKDVFLRELISNASDALDKIRYLAIQNPQFLDGKEELEIRVEYDDDDHTLTIRDSGIGMTKEDLVKNLGTVARSGTSKFLDAMQDGKADMNMIGQFGVGFYSSFLVSSRVRVASKHPEDPVQHIWESLNGESSFHVYDDPRGNSLGRGTEITLYLKDNAHEYSESTRLKDLATHYSEFVTHPIFLRSTQKEMVPVEEEEEEIKDADFDEDLEVEEETDADAEEEEKEPEMEEITTFEWDQLNTNPPIWTRSKDTIEDEEYQSFFHVVSKDTKNATSWTHFDAEGSINFKSILYMPSELPDHLLYNYAPPAKEVGLNLYVRRVLISDSFELMPKWLSFVKGVVDSDDLPLNVNRETVQENKIIKIIRKKLIRKVLEMLRKLSTEKNNGKEVELDENGNAFESDDLDVEDSEGNRYIAWYKKWNPSLKMGVIEDYSNQDKILKLLRFKSSLYPGEDDYITLEEYIGRMKEWQGEIYFFPGEKVSDMENSHFMDKFKSKGVEVLYFTDPVDEYMIGRVQSFKDHKFEAITKDNIKFKDEDEDLVKRREKAYKKKFDPLIKYLKKSYGSAVTKVVVSSRLEKAPAMISTSQYGSTANMERLLRAQSYQHGNDDVQNRASRVFEINPRHPFVTSLLELVPPADDNEEDPFKVLDSTKDSIWLLHDVALLNSGFTITNTKSFSKRMTRVLKGQLDIVEMELADEIDVPEEEEEAPEFDEDMMDGLNMEDLKKYDDVVTDFDDLE